MNLKLKILLGLSTLAMLAGLLQTARTAPAEPLPAVGMEKAPSSGGCCGDLPAAEHGCGMTEDQPANCPASR